MRPNIPTPILISSLAFLTIAAATASRNRNNSSQWPIECRLEHWGLSTPVPVARASSFWDNIRNSIWNTTSPEPLYNTRASLVYTCNITSARQENLTKSWVVPSLVLARPEGPHNPSMPPAQNSNSTPAPEQIPAPAPNDSIRSYVAMAIAMFFVIICGFLFMVVGLAAFLALALAYLKKATVKFNIPRVRVVWEGQREEERLDQAAFVSNQDSGAGPPDREAGWTEEVQEAEMKACEARYREIEEADQPDDEDSSSDEQEEAELSDWEITTLSVMAGEDCEKSDSQTGHRQSSVSAGTTRW